MKPSAFFSALLVAAFLAFCFYGRSAAVEVPPGFHYPPEEIYDTSSSPDEALVNVNVAVNRWPDCSTVKSAIEDIFRIEGVKDAKRDEDRAFALWKWMRILLSATGGPYTWEGLAGKERIVHDPHKIFTVYGRHMCDGLSWVMAPMWRAAGYIAFDECTPGHTIASLRYRDDDGLMRFHDFDLQSRFFHWDDTNKRVGTWTMPLIVRRVHRHLLAPQRLHSLRTSLRVGEIVERRWDNTGHVIPGRDEKAFDAEVVKSPYYLYQPGRMDGVYATSGEEFQTFEADAAPAGFASALYEGSANTACSAPAEGKAALHPAKAGETAVFVYRLRSPYPVVDAVCEAALLKGDAADLCRLSVSTDGADWKPIVTKEKTGEEKVAIAIGREARMAKQPDVYTAYDFFVKAEFKAARGVSSVGMKGLKLTIHRQLNKRALPHLRPGENWVRVTADRLAEGLALELEIRYTVNGEAQSEKCLVRRFPHYFKIVTPDVPEQALKNYDQKFNDGALRMSAVRMRLVGAAGAAVSASLPEVEGLAAFAKSAPHPADLKSRGNVKTPETDIRQTNGFFPQSKVVLDDDAAMNERIPKLKSKNEVETWRVSEELGNYPKSVDALCAALPKANIDMTLFICKALAQIADKKAVGPLLEKWKNVPSGAPGTRYIPDALAAIGDRSAVPALIAPLKRVRFDFRFHIAYALGVLGGPEAEKALEDLAANDPFPAVKEYAGEELKALRARR
ncbi:MAG: HEAT repeat domain-containing protein [Planctomycetota bacterium]